MHTAAASDFPPLPAPKAKFVVPKPKSLADPGATLFWLHRFDSGWDLLDIDANPSISREADGTTNVLVFGTGFNDILYYTYGIKSAHGPGDIEAIEGMIKKAGKTPMWIPYDVFARKAMHVFYLQSIVYTILTGIQINPPKDIEINPPKDIAFAHKVCASTPLLLEMLTRRLSISLKLAMAFERNDLCEYCGEPMQVAIPCPVCKITMYCCKKHLYADDDLHEKACTIVFHGKKRFEAMPFVEQAFELERRRLDLANVTAVPILFDLISARPFLNTNLLGEKVSAMYKKARLEAMLEGSPKLIDLLTKKK
jgi:hypothetical protein